MSPVTCFRRILSHDVCKLVIEAARSSLRSVAGELSNGHRKELRARDAHYYQASATQVTSCRLIISF